jgi:hypothetical protein
VLAGEPLVVMALTLKVASSPRAAPRGGDPYRRGQGVVLGKLATTWFEGRYESSVFRQCPTGIGSSRRRASCSNKRSAGPPRNSALPNRAIAGFGCSWPPTPNSPDSWRANLASVSLGCTATRSAAMRNASGRYEHARVSSAAAAPFALGPVLTDDPLEGKSLCRVQRIEGQPGSTLSGDQTGHAVATGDQHPARDCAGSSGRTCSGVAALSSTTRTRRSASSER